MSRKPRLDLPEGFRLIRKGDRTVPFVIGDPVMGVHPLTEYYEASRRADSYVILRLMGSRIAAALLMVVHPEHIELAMLVRNQRYPEYKGAGGDLVRLIETVVAPQLGKTELRMEALDRKPLVRYYDDVLRYQEYAERYVDPEWGSLVPKRKFLKPVPRSGRYLETSMQWRRFPVGPCA